jgi:hypothetical protein
MLQAGHASVLKNRNRPVPQDACLFSPRPCRKLQCSTFSSSVQVVKARRTIMERPQWPTTTCDDIPVQHLAKMLAHTKFAATHISKDDQRPCFRCQMVGTDAQESFLVSIAPSGRDRRGIVRQLPAAAAYQKFERRTAYPQNTVSEASSSTKEELWTCLADTTSPFYVVEKHSRPHDATAR